MCYLGDGSIRFRAGSHLFEHLHSTTQFVQRLLLARDNLQMPFAATLRAQCAQLCCHARLCFQLLHLRCRLHPLFTTSVFEFYKISCLNYTDHRYDRKYSCVYTHRKCIPNSLYLFENRGIPN